MAAKNRTDLAAALAALAAVVDLSELKAVITDILDSILINRDVSSTVTVAGTGTTNVDFSGKDVVYVSTAYDCVLNIQNIVDGDVKFLHVAKTAGIAVTFTGATDQFNDLVYGVTLTDIVWMITKKHYTTVLLVPLVVDIDLTKYYLKTETYSQTEADVLLAAKQATLVESAVFNGTRIGAYIDAGTFYCEFVSFGKVVVCSGQLKFNTLPSSPGAEIIDFPAEIDAPKHTVWFAGGTSTGIGRPVFNAYIDGTTKKILFNTGDNGYVYYFNFMFITD